MAFRSNRPDIAPRVFELLGLIFAATLLTGCPAPSTTQPVEKSDGSQVVDAQPLTVREAPPTWVSSDPATGRVHLVQANETLWSLAERYYGHGKHWRKIAVANRNRLRESEQLTVGMKLIIP